MEEGNVVAVCGDTALRYVSVISAYLGLG